MPLSALLTQLARSRDLGFLGDGALEEHVEHGSVLLREALGPDDDVARSVLDLGSGGGLPGLIAVASGRWFRVVLLDRSERRCAFLRSAVPVLAPTSTHVEVVCGQAEDLARGSLRECFDAVVARSFGPPAATVECASGFLAVGGRLVLSDPPGGRTWPSDVSMLGLYHCESSASPPAWSVFSKVESLHSDYPRRAGVPVKRPLFTV